MAPGPAGQQSPAVTCLLSCHGHGCSRCCQGLAAAPVALVAPLLAALTELTDPTRFERKRKKPCK